MTKHECVDCSVSQECSSNCACQSLEGDYLAQERLFNVFLCDECMEDSLFEACNHKRIEAVLTKLNKIRKQGKRLN